MNSGICYHEIADEVYFLDMKVITDFRERTMSFFIIFQVGWTDGLSDKKNIKMKMDTALSG